MTEEYVANMKENTIYITCEKNTSNSVLIVINYQQVFIVNIVVQYDLPIQNNEVRLLLIVRHYHRIIIL